MSHANAKYEPPAACYTLVAMTDKTLRYYWADRCEVSGNGDLILHTEKYGVPSVFAAGSWIETHPASVMDGLPLTLDPN